MRHPELTRSQLIFSLATQTDPRTLTIQRGDEFFLFMDLRAEHQWASYKMTSHKWILATKAYNLRLQSSCSLNGHSYIAKNPRALMDKLSEIEQIIAHRITTGNYMCTHSIYFIFLVMADISSAKRQTDTFWKRHCHVVTFIKTEDGPSQTAQAEKIVSDLSLQNDEKSNSHPAQSSHMHPLQGNHVPRKDKLTRKSQTWILLRRRATKSKIW